MKKTLKTWEKQYSVSLLHPNLLNHLQYFLECAEKLILYPKLLSSRQKLILAVMIYESYNNIQYFCCQYSLKCFITKHSIMYLKYKYVIYNFPRYLRAT